MTPKELRKNRQALGLTVVKLAEMIGVSRESITKWESDTKPLLPRNAKLVEMAFDRVKNTQSTKDSILSKAHEIQSQLESEGMTNQASPNLSNQQMSIALMSTASTSSASLELLCEVLSIVANTPLAQVRERAKSITQEKGLKLSYVLDVMT
jgi:predicted transcriptional regulator